MSAIEPGANPKPSGVRRPGDPVSKADIEAKLTELKSGVDEQIANIRGIAIAAGVAVVAVLVVGTFLIGRRRGKKLATVIEIRRV